jgi:transposase
MASRSRRTVESSTGSMMEPEFLLEDEQWNLIADLFPESPVGPEGGRPRVPARRCVEGILWILRTGAPWRDLPDCFPSPATCWRRLKQWTEDGIWEMAWGRLLRKLDRQRRIDREESFADGTFSSAKKGAKRLAKRSEARGPNSWSLPMVMESLWVSIQPAPVLTK